ncbi:hypothetical protein N8824_01580 [Candidatus Pelagibacter sp.]|nr:hypothetical protein [Candidatus Pelagibacter sp.]
MNIYIRTDANKSIGLGHFSRTLRLANYFNKKGHCVEIFLDKKNDLITSFAKDNPRININFLYGVGQNFINQKKDAKIFIKRIKKDSTVILDDYRLDYNWEKKVRAYVKRVAIIEDQNLAEHYCDVIINSNPKYIEKDNYIDKNKLFRSINLLGPMYSILDNENRKTQQNRKNLTFYFGGSGNLIYFFNLINQFYKNKLNRKNNINFIIGPLCKNKKKIYLLEKKINNFKIHENKTNISNILSKTDLLICSSGMITIESAFQKIPSICFQVSNNQIIENKYLEKLGLYINLKKADLSNYQKVSEIIELYIKNIEFYSKIFQPKIKIDNLGKKRIFDAILFKQEKNKIKKKSANLDFSRRLYALNDLAVNEYLDARNLLINRKNSGSAQKIKILDHYIWWLKDKKKINVLIKNNKKMMYIRNDIIQNYNQKICFNGFVIANEKLNGLDVIWALKKNLEFLEKNHKRLKIFSVVKKNNNFANLHTKFINFQLYRFQSKSINQVIKKKIGSLDKLNVYVYKNHY